MLSMYSCIRRNVGTIWLTIIPSTTAARGMATRRTTDSPTSWRSAMITPTTIVIGAAMAIVQAITTSICTCCTSLVMRVMSDGAPNVPTSRAENSVTRWNRAARMSRPKPIATRAPTRTAATAKTTWTIANSSMTAPRGADVGGVAGQDALVDDVGVEGREGQRRRHLHALQHDEQEEVALVGAEVGAEEAGQHDGPPAHAVEEQRRDLLRRHRLLGHHRVARGQREGPEVAAGRDRVDRDLVAVRLEDGHEGGAVGHRAAHAVVEAGADARHEPPDLDGAALQDRDGLGEHALERRGRVELAERLLHRRRDRRLRR